MDDDCRHRSGDPYLVRSRSVSTHNNDIFVWHFICFISIYYVTDFGGRGGVDIDKFTPVLVTLSGSESEVQLLYLPLLGQIL